MGAFHVGLEDAGMVLRHGDPELSSLCLGSCSCEAAGRQLAEKRVMGGKQEFPRTIRVG